MGMNESKSSEGRPHQGIPAAGRQQSKPSARHQTSVEMNARTVGRGLTTSLGWLLLASGAFAYFVYFNDQQLVASDRLDVKASLPAIKDPFNRSRCCLPGAGSVDVCGRLNCTRHCPDPIQPAIPDGPGDKAFFIETSGSGTLSVRQACAVESLAFHNPDLDVNVLFVDDRRRDRRIDQGMLDESAGRLREKYKNIRFVVADLDEYLAGTALEKWFHCSDWRKGPYHVSHLSDGLRFLTLAKYGGYYFDLDVLAVRAVTYYRNFVACPDDYNVASNSIHADLDSPVVALALQNFVSNYRSGIWAHNGPALLLRVLKKWCNASDVASMNYVRCRGFHVLPRSSFNPVHFSKWDQLFAQRPPRETGPPKWLGDQVLGVHTCNKMSSGGLLYKNSTQEYVRLARDHCPRVFAAAPPTF